MKSERAYTIIAEETLIIAFFNNAIEGETLYTLKNGGVYMMALIIIAVILLVIVFWGVGVYNGLVKAKNKAEEAEAGIDAHLTQRYDLIPNLVETVKGYAKHESATLEAVIKARNSAISATGTEAKDQADGAVSTALKSLFALSESYPELKANENFRNLQNQLKEVEEELLSARKYYNAAARIYNDQMMVFPASMIANIAHFQKLAYVKAEAEAKGRVEVKF